MCVSMSKSFQSKLAYQTQIKIVQKFTVQIIF